jgi:hypothetical protein
VTSNIYHKSGMDLDVHLFKVPDLTNALLPARVVFAGADPGFRNVIT